MLLALIPLIGLERWIARHLQGVFLLLFRSPDVALVLYSMVMLPGTVLRHVSQLLAATLLGIRTRRISFIPELKSDGTSRLGFLETDMLDIPREMVIGATPLIAGATAIVFISYQFLEISTIINALDHNDLGSATKSILQIWRIPRDAWLWLYIIFAVSNSMIPTRNHWPHALVMFALAGGVLFYAQFTSAFISDLAQLVDAALSALALGFALTAGLNLLLVPLIWLVERALTGLTGWRLEY